MSPDNGMVPHVIEGELMPACACMDCADCLVLTALSCMTATCRVGMGVMLGAAVHSGLLPSTPRICARRCSAPLMQLMSWRYASPKIIAS